MSVVGLDHVQVAAPRGCEAEARRFYGTLLGLVEIEKPESLRGRGGVWFRCGEQQLHGQAATIANGAWLCQQHSHLAFAPDDWMPRMAYSVVKYRRAGPRPEYCDAAL